MPDRPPAAAQPETRSAVAIDKGEQRPARRWVVKWGTALAEERIERLQTGEGQRADAGNPQRDVGVIGRQAAPGDVDFASAQRVAQIGGKVVTAEDQARRGGWIAVPGGVSHERQLARGDRVDAVYPIADDRVGRRDEPFGRE